MSKNVEDRRTKAILNDAFVLDGIRRTADGYLVASARVARTGIQVYKGREVGRPDLGDVAIYRPAGEVFHADAMRSMAHKPVTVYHPNEPVNDANWSKYAKGHTGDEIVRDGDYIRVPMVLMDAAAIKAVESGTKELSMGYSTDLKWEKGVTADGQPYDAVQTSIRANHLAIVPVARGGTNLRLGDARKHAAGSNRNTVEISKMAKTVLIDGAPIEFNDELAASVVANALTRLQASVKDAEEDAEKAKKDKSDCEDGFKKQIDAKDGEIAVLKKQVADAAITPEKLDVLVKQRADVVDAALRVIGKTVAFDGKTVDDIRREAVAAKLGDAAKTMSDAAIEGAFAALTVDAKPVSGVHTLGTALGMHAAYGARPTLNDAREQAIVERDRRLQDAWKVPPGSVPAKN